MTWRVHPPFEKTRLFEKAQGSRSSNATAAIGKPSAPIRAAMSHVALSTASLLPFEQRSELAEHLAA